MTKNSQRPLIGAAQAAMAAVALAGCSAAPSTTASSTPGPVASTVTVSATPPSTVTVTPSATPNPTSTVASPPAAHFTGPGAFQSPSGNIHCALFSFNGQASVQCESTDHTWSAPPKSADCHLNWGSRLELQQGGQADFACYGQELPAPQRTLDYGARWSVGEITCASESAGITCTDAGTGHLFFVSRDTYRIG